MTSTLVPGAIVAGSYRLSERLGSGGMGEVWAAVHQVTGREVAVKCLRAAAYRHSDARVRFQREARAACAVDHPNVVEIIDFSEREGEEPMIVMERLRGETLADRLENEGALSLEATASLIVPVISALGTAHSRGIVHRDLKPSNIFIAQRSREPATVVKVLDFGIAKWSELQESGPALRTETGSALGTPTYMAPEQALAEKTLDHRADVWALGVILYECLAGTRPVEGDNAAQVALRLLSVGIVPLERVNTAVPPDVARLTRQMLTRDVARRSPDLREAFAVLSRYTSVVAPAFSEPSARLAVSDTGSEPNGSPRVFSWTPLRNPAVELPTTFLDRLQSNVPTTLHPRSGARRFGGLALGIGAVGLIWLARTRDTAGHATATASPAVPLTSVTAAPTRTLAPSAAPMTLGSPAMPDASVEAKPDGGVPKARKAGATAPATRSTKKATEHAPLAPSSSATSVEKRRLPTGAACEKSSDCESGQCVAYACR
jgi:serine/threonine-protein kinase